MFLMSYSATQAINQCYQRMKIYPTENILELDLIRTKGPISRTYVL